MADRRVISVKGQPNVLGRVTHPRTNRTGAATVVGGAYFVDEARAQAESTSVETAQDNLTPAATALFTHGLLVIAAEAFDDNARGPVYEGDGLLCRVLVDSTTDIAAGDPLIPVNAAAHMVKGTAGTNRAYAIAMEARTPNDTGLILAKLYSRGFCTQNALG